MYNYSSIVKKIALAYSNAIDNNETEAKVYFVDGKDLYMIHFSWDNRKPFIKFYLMMGIDSYALINDIAIKDYDLILAICREIIIENTKINFTM